MTSFVRQTAMEWQSSVQNDRMKVRGERCVPSLCALVRGEKRALEEEGCRLLASWGNIHIADIPLNRLNALAMRTEVQRIEANRPCEVSVDTTSLLLGVDDLWFGRDGYAPLTGRGVVVGVTDVGFDLTHPTFLDETMQISRISRLWDMLDSDTLTSTLYVGRDYTSPDALQKKAHSTDGLIISHGTHTSSTAAGAGARTPFIGMAPEAELCLVANMVTSNQHLVPEELHYKHTSATNLLAFKYIFDYAENQGKPCVVSFSEGHSEDMAGENELLYAVLDSLTGPGRIFVSSAGNNSIYTDYYLKPAGEEVAWLLLDNSNVVGITTCTDRPVSYTLHFEGDTTMEYSVDMNDVTTQPDSTRFDTLTIGTDSLVFIVQVYPSCYDPSRLVTDIVAQSLGEKGLQALFTKKLLYLTGIEATVEAYAILNHFRVDSRYPEYAVPEASHNINAPAAAPAAIAVGATMYRPGVVNYQSVWKEYEVGGNGSLASFSSIGPSMGGLTKPDVVAPGVNIIAAYSSYYLEAMPNARDIQWDTQHFDFNGRTYAWNANSGTSMSAPVVAGIIALWLQAFPWLTPDDVRRVFAATCTHHNPALTYPNNLWGNGEIDARAGLEYIAKHADEFSGIPHVVQRNEPSHAVTFDLWGRPANNKIKGIIVQKRKAVLR